MHSHLLLVDDDEDFCEWLSAGLRAEGHRVTVLGDGRSVEQHLDTAQADTVLLDLGLGRADGMDVLSRLRSSHPRVPVVILTGDESIERVVQAIRLGAFDYLTKPVDPTKLSTTLRNALDSRRLMDEVADLRRLVETRAFSGIIGHSPAMLRLFRRMERAATTEVSVLIQGESGSGKELVARAIHESGPRRKGPFIAVNAAALPDTLIESELFGHERGAFTGAVAQRKGRFEQAHQGTLFLDEVGELPLAFQVKLLRVLQERRIQRLGGHSEFAADFRVICATHRDLRSEVAAGRFREDLYFRLAVYEIDVPPLREREDDILLLAEHFLRVYGTFAGVSNPSLSPEAKQALRHYNWPGNIREFQNAIQQALLDMSGSEIGLDALPARIRPTVPVNPVVPIEEATAPRGPASSPPRLDDALTPSLEDASRQWFAQAIERNHGNASAAMRELSVTRPRFYRLVRKYGLDQRLRSARGRAKPGQEESDVRNGEQSAHGHGDQDPWS